MDPVSSLDSTLERADRYFMGESHLHLAASELARVLEDLGVEFAIAGALALAAHGHERLTSGVGVLLTREGHARLKAAVLGRGYVELFEGSKGLRDTGNGVKIDFILSGDFPGDGKPKPVAFPDPGSVRVQAGRYPVVRLETLVELKLASGMTAPHRLQDLGCDRPDPRPRPGRGVLRAAASVRAGEVPGAVAQRPGRRRGRVAAPPCAPAVSTVLLGGRWLGGDAARRNDLGRRPVTCWEESLLP